MQTLRTNFLVALGVRSTRTHYWIWLY